MNDPSAYGYNLFAYCGNDPVNNVDPSGDLLWDILDWGFAGYSWSKFYYNPSWGNLGEALLDTVSLLPIVPSVGYVTKADDAIDLATGLLKSGLPLGAVKTADTIKTSYNLPAPPISLANFPDSGVCFVAGTPIKAEAGIVPIEDIKTNDFVWAWDENTGEVELKKVVETFVNETNELIHVFVNGEEIITTPEHPFYSPVKGWTSAVHLHAGDILVLVNGNYVVVEKVQHELLESPITVYNFEVEDYHTYYVGETGVLVHNVCTFPSPNKFTPDQSALIDLAKEYRKTGVTYFEAGILIDWAKEYGIKYHDPTMHINRSGYWSNHNHINIFKYHIEVLK